MNKQILILMVFILTVGMATNVFGAACTASSCTPTCEFSFPSSNNYALEDGNTTMVAMIQEGTTSGFYNVTKYNIDKYINSTNTINTSENSLGPAIWSDLPDGTYKLDATIFYDNASAEVQNLTVTQAACDSRYFTVSTKEGQYVPEITEEKLTTTEKITGKPTKTDTKTIFIIAVIVFLAIWIWKNSKK